MTRRPYHNYIFLSYRQKCDGCGREEVRRDKGALLAAMKKAQSDVRISSYSLLGFKRNIAALLWLRGNTPEAVQSALFALVRGGLLRLFRIEHTLFGIARESPYSRKPIRPMSENPRAPYLMIYPFVKTSDWYLLPFAERKEMMSEHIRRGLVHKGIRQLLLYSTGVDDQEFIVSYETRSLIKFQDLVMDLRSTKARSFTERDTPLFLCLRKPMKDILRIV